MEMVRKNDNRIHMEGMLLSYVSKCRAKQVNPFHQQSIASALGGVYREEPRTTRQPGATVFGYRGISTSFFANDAVHPGDTGSLMGSGFAS